MANRFFDSVGDKQLMDILENETDGYPADEENIVFHYKRGSFRNRENEIYRNLATGKTKTSKGLFRTLVATKGNRMMFFALLMCTALCFIIFILSSRSGSDKIGTALCDLSAFSFEGKVYASLSVKSEEKVLVSASFEAVNTDGAVCDKFSVQGEFSSGQDGFLRALFNDYDVAVVKCTVSSSGESAELSVSVEAR